MATSYISKLISNSHINISSATLLLWRNGAYLRVIKGTKVIVVIKRM